MSSIKSSFHTCSHSDIDEAKTKKNGVVIRYNHPITAQQGRNKKIIFADLVVTVHNAPVIVIDAKNPRSYLIANDREQVVSYARLLPTIAPYAALCNGGWQVFETVRKQQIKELPRLQALLSDIPHLGYIRVSQMA